MKTIGLGMGLVVVLVLKPAAGQNLVVNGDFEGGFSAETHLCIGYQIANGWSWVPFPIDGSCPTRSSNGCALRGPAWG